MLSLRDSIIKPDDLILRLKEIGQDAIAITDHGTSLGGVRFYKILKENNIKYIHGCEMYICDDVSIKDKDNRYYHLIVLCLNETGRLNLNRLMSKSEHPDNFYYKPRIDFSLLSQYSEGLLVSSACMAGEISKYIEEKNYNKAKETALKYKSLFRENYYLEVQSHNDDKQIEINKQIIKLGQDLDIECVVTSDAHYVWEKDKDYQNKYAFNGSYKEDGEAYVDCFIQSEQDVRDRLWYFSNDVIDKLIRNTHIIADKCNVRMPLSAPIMPHINTPKEFKSNKEWLEKICKDGFVNKLNIDCLDEDIQKIYRDRYEYEINSLDRMGFIDYILLVYSYANVAKRRGIARGSGGGSLVCYLANITNIDPIEHGLYFERFIDVGALDLLESGQITENELKIPDIDLDFSSESCKEVLNYLYNTYGEENVASIGKFGTNQTKGTIRDMCKVLDIDLTTADKIAKSFDNYEIEDIDYLVNNKEKIPDSAKDAIAYIETYPVLFDYVRKLNGLPKSFGLHACGKVISTRPLDEFLPSCYDSDGIRYLQGDMHDVEDVGLVKIDVLGLRTLDQEYNTMEMSNKSIESINPKIQNYSDPKVLDIFRKGDTVGIFQFSSYGMRETLKKMDVRGIEDLAIANALYRPGAMAYIDNFCRRRKGFEEFEYLHPDLEPILKNTYGIIVFQEQLIEIGRMAGIRNPDLLRKATGKKDVKLLNKVKPELEEKLKLRGWTDAQFDRLWSDMIEFSKYSFNKCVSGKTKLKRLGQKNSAFHPTIEEMYKIKNNIEYAKLTGHYDLHKKYKHKGYGNALSMSSDNRVHKNKIVDIYYSGVRETYKIKLISGKEIICTLNHKFPTENGIKQLSELSVGDRLYIVGEYEICKNKYNLTDGNFESNIPHKGQFGFQKRPNGSSVLFNQTRKDKILGQANCDICNKEYSDRERFELHHKDGNRKNNCLDNYAWCCNSCHKKVEYKLNRNKVFEKGLPTLLDEIYEIIYNGEEDVYDIEMLAPDHNFVTLDGIITSNSHSAAYAIIAFITAKQKAYHPAEFFAGLCNSYIGKSGFVKDDADDIVSDMSKHKVRFVPFNYKNDHRRCSTQNNKLIYAVPLIKDCNEIVAEALYKSSQKNFDTFWKLVKDLYLNGVDKSQMRILIKLDFFKDFGNSKKLLRIVDIFEFFKCGESASIKKDKLDGNDFLYNIVSQNSNDKGVKGDVLKSFKIENIENILNECEKYILSLDIDDFDYKNKMATQKEYLGFVLLLTGKEEDRPKLYVKKIFPAKRKKDGKQFGYNIIAQSIGSGKETTYTVFNQLYNSTPINEGDIIECFKYEQNGKYFTIKNYQQIL
jgi:DNA polymerase-3 subunit alpha